MRKFAFKKLVRDKIADQIQSGGGVVHKRILDDKEYVFALKQKLIEEAKEVSKSSNQDLAKELADVYEILEAIGRAKGISVEQVKSEQGKKKHKNGSFDSRIYIENVAVSEENSWLAYYLHNPDRYPEMKDTKHHAVFREKDVFPHLQSSQEGVIFEDRPTGKAVIFDSDNFVGLVGNTVNSLYQLPGGGIDVGESIEAGIRRECLEEAGCHVRLRANLGTTADYRIRDRKHCVSYCYTAKVVGEKGRLHLTKEETKSGLHIVWVSLDEAIAISEKQVAMLKRGEIHFYNTGFNILRDHIFLLEARKLQKNMKCLRCAT